MMISRSETIKLYGESRVLTSSTSKGNQIKWYKNGYWYKANQLGYEDIAEVAATLVLRCSNLEEGKDYIGYSLCNIAEVDTGEFYKGCESKNFVTNDFSLVTLYRLLERARYDPDRLFGITQIDKIIKITEEITKLDVLSYFKNLVTLDALILNEDRHFNNIAFLYKDGVFKVAPIFDNGLSLLSDVRDYPESRPVHINMRKVKSRTFSSSFSKQLEALGVGFKVDGDLLSKELERNKDILGRAGDVLRVQMNKYRNVIVF